jgi:hypothetical protein
VGSLHREHVEIVGFAPAEPLTQIETVCVAGRVAVSSEEPGYRSTDRERIDTGLDDSRQMKMC